MGYFTQQSMIGPSVKPVLDSQVDFNQETVEGRIGGLLGTDASGNYLNPVVRQTVDRQEQAFNARGLRNSSMAVQAGAEAAISRATDIAQPDAQTYYNNRRGDVDATNTLAREETGFIRDMAKQEGSQDFEREKLQSTQDFDLAKQRETQAFDLSKQKDSQAFTTRQDYQRAVQTIGTNYQRQIDTINSSSMTPTDKSVAIQQAAAVRDGETAFQNTLYSRMPQWQQEWLAPSIGTTGLDISGVNNADALSTIANHPGQTQATREAAAARLSALGLGGAGGSSMIGGAKPAIAGYTSDGTPLPATTAKGQPMDWSLMTNVGTMTQAYEQYQRNPYNGPMTPEQFYSFIMFSGQRSGSSVDNGGDGSDGGASAAAAAAASAAADGGGISA